MLHVAFGSSKYSNRLALHTFTVPQFFKKLRRPEIRDNKNGPYFILAEFKNLSKGRSKVVIGRSIRNSSNLLTYHGAVLDLDNCDMTLEQVIQSLPKCAYFLYTTYSHRLAACYHEDNKPPSNRYRLIIPYRTSAPVTTHLLLVQKLSARLGYTNLDVSANSVSQPMFLPSVHPKNVDNYQYECNADYPLMSTKLSPQDMFELHDMADRTGTPPPSSIDINQQIYEGEGRNAAACKIVGKFIASGMDQNTLIGATSAWNEVNCKPPLSRRELRTVIKSITKGHENRSGSWGFDELSRRIQTTNVDSFEQMLKLIAHAKPSALSPARRELLLRELSKKLKLPVTFVKDEFRRATLQTEEDETEAEEQKERTSVKELRREFKDWVYVAAFDKVYNLKKGYTFGIDGFNRMHQHKVDKGTMLSLLLKHYGIQVADRIEFAPGEDILFSDEDSTFVNTYRPPKILPLYRCVKPMIKHFRLLIPNSQERGTLLDYIAYLVQKPGKKILFMPVIKGRSGIGKSIIANRILPTILGRQNIKGVKARKVDSDFNSWQLDTQLVIFHELKLGTTRTAKLNLTEELKDIITEDYMQASRKGIDDYDVKNNLNIMAFTNHEDAIMITPDERRFFMIRSEMDKQTPRYYRKIHAWLEDNPEAMYFYFLNRDLSHFDPYTLPESEYTNEIKEQSYLWPQSVLAFGLRDPNHWSNTEHITTWRFIVDYIRQNSSGKDSLECENLTYAMSSHSYKLINALKDCGFRKASDAENHGRIRTSTGYETLWLTPNGVKQWAIKPLNANEIRLSLEKQK